MRTLSVNIGNGKKKLRFDQNWKKSTLELSKIYFSLIVAQIQGPSQCPICPFSRPH